MRKTNNLPWIGRTVSTSIMALVGLGVLAGSASAQNSPIILDNVMGWWNHLGCEMRINAVNAVTGLDTDHPVFAEPTPGEVFSATANDSTRQWCLMFDDLGQNEQRALNAGANQGRDATAANGGGGITTTASDRVFDKMGWWTGMQDEWVFRTNWNADFGGSGTRISEEVEPRFREVEHGFRKWNIDSGGSGTSVPGVVNARR